MQTNSKQTERTTIILAELLADIEALPGVGGAQNFTMHQGRDCCHCAGKPEVP